MISKKNRLNFIFLSIGFLFIVFCYIFIFVRNDIFNKKDRILDFSFSSNSFVSESLNTDEDISVLMEERKNDSSKWKIALSDEASKKTGFSFLNGIIFDITVKNESLYEVVNWNLTFTIAKDCFIESAWCGRVDIFQQRDEKIFAQNINLRNFNSSMINIEHVINNDKTFFPLKKNDVIVYYPSLEEREYPLIANSFSMTKPFTEIGFIFYGEDIPTTDYFSKLNLTYRLNRRISQDPAFKIISFILVCWTIAFFFFLFSVGRLNELEQLELHDKKMIQEVMETFSGFVDAKDPYTGGHSIRVGKYAKLLANELGLDKKQCQTVFYCGILHDCGKISIHDSILSKPKRLTDYEFSIIKSHTIHGFEILSGLTAIPEACMVARYHHERFDGRGYPDGLLGNSIPLYARIVCLADAFDAMNSNRCYREHMTADMIIKQINDNSGIQFDPDVADAMIRLLLRGEIIFSD